MGAQELKDYIIFIIITLGISGIMYLIGCVQDSLRPKKKKPAEKTTKPLWEKYQYPIIIPRNTEYKIINNYHINIWNINNVSINNTGRGSQPKHISQSIDDHSLDLKRLAHRNSSIHDLLNFERD